MAKSAKSERVTPFQRKTCEGIASGLSLAQAAVNAGSKSKNPEVVASRMLAKPHVKAYLATLDAKVEKVKEIDGIAEIKRVLLEIIQFDPADVISEIFATGAIYKPFSDWGEGARKCIKSIKTGKGGMHIEFYDKLQAIDRYMRFYGMIKPNGDETPGPSIGQIMLDEFPIDQLNKGQLRVVQQIIELTLK